MDRWEYKVLNFGGVLKSVKAEAMEAELNSLGQDGWESYGAVSGDSGSRILVLLKKRIGGATKQAADTWGKW